MQKTFTLTIDIHHLVLYSKMYLYIFCIGIIISVSIIISISISISITIIISIIISINFTVSISIIIIDQNPKVLMWSWTNPTRWLPGTALRQPFYSYSEGNQPEAVWFPPEVSLYVAVVFVLETTFLLDGEQNRERCQQHPRDEPTVPGGENHPNPNLRVQILEGGMLRSHRSVAC